MRIREGRSEDVDQIQRLFRQLDAHHVGLIPHVFVAVDGDARPESIVTDWIEGKDSAYLMAETDGVLVGFVNVRITSDPAYPMYKSYRYADIANAIVDEPYRGQGIGRMLFDAAIQWASERNVHHIRTSVWQANSNALQFYINQGFHPMTVRLELNTKNG